MKKVLVVLPVNGQQKEKIRNSCPEFDFTFEESGKVTEQMIAEANAIVGNIPAGKLRSAEKLELLQLNSAGADQYIADGILPAGAVLANATGAYNKTVAEHTFALALELMKNLHLYRDNQRQNAWKDEGKAGSFENAKVLIVGCGSIGLRFARYAGAFGAYTIGVKTKAGELPDELDELWATDNLDQVLPQADLVVSFLPQTKDTVHIFNRRTFSLMKKTAIFINCGRGSAVNHEDLEYALKNGLIASAAIDVCEEEPLSASSSLWNIENLVITPHVAGGYHLDDTLDQIVDISVRNLAALRDHAAFVNVVDLKTGYVKK